MRFMVIVRANKDSEAGKIPADEELTAMGKYNEELTKAGVLLDVNGLHPTSKGSRVRFSGNERTVVDGPFPETKELIAGYWLLQVKSKQEALEWVRRAPMRDTELEVRQVYEIGDFEMSPDALASHEAVAAKLRS